MYWYRNFLEGSGKKSWGCRLLPFLFCDPEIIFWKNLLKFLFFLKILNFSPQFKLLTSQCRSYRNSCSQVIIQPCPFFFVQQPVEKLNVRLKWYVLRVRTYNKQNLTFQANNNLPTFFTHVPS